ncbi:hypothetical protein R5W23_001896 [Gemmata sp. JC673]|uniref:Uncharacterized protein n=1 Tax=Gemmata algarum TaxID=2975278 RepID=A0ABU5EZC4_9BACT|nr:hypothetical protein [Gemmata algarum]MDY3560650.1 hypothetical protein [Gemmata algarum]
MLLKACDLSLQVFFVPPKDLDRSAVVFAGPTFEFLPILLRNLEQFTEALERALSTVGLQLLWIRENTRKR